MGRGRTSISSLLQYVRQTGLGQDEARAKNAISVNQVGDKGSDICAVTCCCPVTLAGIQVTSGIAKTQTDTPIWSVIHNTQASIMVA